MRLLEALIEQAKNPKGFLGNQMLKIMNSAHNKMTIWGLSKININEDFTVLDIGCGGGQTLKRLSGIAKNGKVYGVDYSEEAVSASIKENLHDVKDGKVIVKQASVSAIPFPDHFFDVITAFQTHYFWPDLKNDIKDVNRILKTNGQFLLVAELYKINYHMKEYKTQEELRKLFLNSNFSNIDISQTKTDLCLVGTK